MLFNEYFSIAAPVRVDIVLSTTSFTAGTDLSIPCSVTGYPTPTVTWYKDGQILENNDRTQITSKHYYNAYNKNALKTEGYHDHAHIKIPFSFSQRIGHLPYQRFGFWLL